MTKYSLNLRLLEIPFLVVSECPSRVIDLLSDYYASHCYTANFLIIIKCRVINTLNQESQGKRQWKISWSASRSTYLDDSIKNHSISPNYDIYNCIIKSSNVFFCLKNCWLDFVIHFQEVLHRSCDSFRMFYFQI